ncbi:MAG TPA: hypothetical protein VF384_08330 [Planctomycetota bacterium]
MNTSTMFRLNPNRWAKWLTGISAIGALGVVLAIATLPTGDAGRTADPAAKPVTPLAQPPRPAQLELVHAERFQVAKPFQNVWRADKQLVNSGWLLVLSGDPALLVPRQVKEPVLYVGAQTAQRVNTGQESGRLVVIVPGDFQLDDAPIFLGDAALPEELRQGQIDQQLQVARGLGAVPPTAAAIENATKNAVWGEFATDFELRLRAIELVEKHSPQEKELIAGWRVPRVPAGK